MLIAHLLKKLPGSIEYQGVTFQLQIFINGDRDVRLCYAIVGVSEDSEHREQYDQYGSWHNPFHDGSFCSFLHMLCLIENDSEMIVCINTMHKFLTDNNLL